MAILPVSTPTRQKLQRAAQKILRPPEPQRPDLSPPQPDEKKRLRAKIRVARTPEILRDVPPQQGNVPTPTPVVTRISPEESFLLKKAREAEREARLTPSPDVRRFKLQELEEAKEALNEIERAKQGQEPSALERLKRGDVIGAIPGVGPFFRGVAAGIRTSAPFEATLGQFLPPPRPQPSGRAELAGRLAAGLGGFISPMSIQELPRVNEGPLLERIGGALLSLPPTLPFGRSLVPTLAEARAGIQAARRGIATPLAQSRFTAPLALRIAGKSQVAGGAITPPSNLDFLRIKSFKQPELQSRFEEARQRVEELGLKVDILAGSRPNEFFIEVQRPGSSLKNNPSAVKEIIEKHKSLSAPKPLTRWVIGRGAQSKKRYFTSFDALDDFLRTGEYKPPAGAKIAPSAEVNAPLPRPPLQPSAATPDFAKNIRLSKYPEDLQQSIKEWATENAALVEEARRGIRSDADVLQAARQLVEEVGGDFDKIQRRWKPGQAWNAEEVTAIRGLLREKTKDVFEAAEAARAADTTENHAAFILALQEQARVQQIVHGVTAEAGRALRSFRQSAMEVIRSGEIDIERLETLLSRYGGRKKITEYADLLLKMDINDPVSVHSFIQAVTKPKMMDYLIELFINSILSGPATFLRNAISNTGALLLAIPERLIAAAVEQPLARLQGRQVERFFGEAPALAWGNLRGLTEGVRLALKTMKTGFQETPGVKLELLEMRPKAFRGRLGKIINTPSNSMEAADALYYSINYRGALEALVLRQARREGLHGTALIDRMAELLKNPPDDIVKGAVLEAQTRLFRQDPGAFVKPLMRLRNEWWPLKFILPFLRTPPNLITYGLQRSPLGFFSPSLWRNIAAKDPRAADQIAAAFVGSTVTASLAWYFLAGNITGAAPTNPADRDLFYRQGKQPFSIKIGPFWVSYRDMEPLSLTFGMVASALNAIKEGKDKEGKDPAVIVGNTVSNIGRFLLDRSFFTGIADAVNAIAEPERYGERWLTRIASAAVPFSAFHRQIAQSLDPTLRRPENLPESILANIPGATSAVPPRLNVFGEVIRRPSPPILPVTISRDVEDEIDKELERLKVRVGFVGDTVGGEKLTREEWVLYQTLAGERMRQDLARLITSPGYGSYSDVAKEKLIQGIVNNAKEMARNMIILQRNQAQGQQPPVQQPSNQQGRLKRAVRIAR